jgi:hypothetical protein
MKEIMAETFEAVAHKIDPFRRQNGFEVRLHDLMNRSSDMII